MADEHVLLVETHVPVPMTVADGTSVTKGSVMKLTDPNTAIINSGDNDVCAGILLGEKIASNGQTKMGVYRGGQFRGTASGSVTVGDALSIDASVNHLKSATTGANVNIVGYALETATTGETFRYELNPSRKNS